jgi:hypothetical protein
MSPWLPDFTDDQKELLQASFLRNPEIYLGRSFLLNRWINKKRDRNTIIKTLKKLKTMGNPGKQAAKDFILRIVNADVKSQLETIYIEYEYKREPEFYIELISYLIDLTKCLNTFTDSFKKEIYDKISTCQLCINTRINCLPNIKKRWCHFSFKNILHSEDYLNLIKAIELCLKLEGEYTEQAYQALEWILDYSKTYLDKICLKELLNCFLNYLPNKPSIIIETYQSLLSNKDITVREFETVRSQFHKFMSKVDPKVHTPYIDFTDTEPKLEMEEYIRRAEALMNMHPAFNCEAWNYLYICIKNFTTNELGIWDMNILGKLNINLINDLIDHIFMNFDYSTQNSSVEDLYRLLDITSLPVLDEQFFADKHQYRRKVYDAILNHKNSTKEDGILINSLQINNQTRLI